MSRNVKCTVNFDTCHAVTAAREWWRDGSGDCFVSGGKGKGEGHP